MKASKRAGNAINDSRYVLRRNRFQSFFFLSFSMLPGTLKNKWNDPTDLRLDRMSILQGKGKGSDGRTREG